jgi:hypothetical protein
VESSDTLTWPPGLECLNSSQLLKLLQELGEALLQEPFDFGVFKETTHVALDSSKVDGLGSVVVLLPLAEP